MSLFLNNLLIGLREMLANKGRSFLTMIGIILGVSSLVLTMGILEGMFIGWQKYLEMRGGLTKITINRSNPPDYQTDIKSRSPGLNINDIHAIKANSQFTKILYFKASTNKTLRFDKKRRWQTVNGVSEHCFEIEGLELKKGRLITAIDIKEAHQVVVIGNYIRHRLLGNDLNPIGKIIKIGDVPYRVIGELKEVKPPNSGAKKRRRGRHYLKYRNYGVYIPYTTFQKKVQYKELENIILQTKAPEYLQQIVYELENILRQSHNGIEDFKVRTNESAMESFNEIKSMYVYVMGGIAAIALLVGGIGIMNVMLASISERIKEIGVRKAVGAQQIHIFMQFLVESATLSALGGFIGILFSIGLTHLLAYMLEYTRINPIITFKSLLIGFIFSTLTGILAGLYPSLKAAKLDPINALHHE